jgi:putative heme-binding domain-containing protein
MRYLNSLLFQWQKTPPEDIVLVHTIKVAVKNLLTATTDDLIEKIHEQGLRADDFPRLAQACLAVPRPDAALLIYLSYSALPWKDNQAPDFAFHTSRYLDETELPKLLLLRDSLRKKPPQIQKEILRSFQRGFSDRGLPLPEEFVAWANELARELFAADDENSQRIGLELVRDLRLASLSDELPAWIAADAKYHNLKTLAIDALGNVGHPRFVELCAELLARPGEPLDVQHHAAQHLGGRNDDAGRAVLLAALKTAPQNLAIGLARGLALGKTGAEALLEAAEKGQASPRLLKDPTVQERLRNGKPKNLEARLKTLFEALPPEDDRLKQLQVARLSEFRKQKRDAEVGAKVFEKNCAACHRLRGKGSKIGPDLDGIGLRGVERLLEDTLDPNRNVDGAFRATVINTTEGKVITGLALREEGDILVLADEQGKELRLSAAEIDERSQTPLSPMPANVAEKITEAEYFDLLQFLLEQKAAPQPAEKQ